MNLTGLILAGGKARRMGGVDKGLVPFLGQPMIAHVIKRLAPQVDNILINANREIASYQPFKLSIVSDEIGDFFGPLAGLHAGLKAAKTDFVLCVPCDSPLLASDLASQLMQALISHHADIAVAKTGAQTHPVFCLCKTSLSDNLAEYLIGGGRKVDEWQKSQAYVEVDFSQQTSAFANINTPEELATLEAFAQKASS
jgi:molybdopterin-guanine dinucleotide biosynthesis protein A